ncbi:MAG: hypothetical protein OXB93_02120 [Cytophagales bacterium]|nr:hypothetical protein [Cytophagales bacterium]
MTEIKKTPADKPATTPIVHATGIKQSISPGGLYWDIYKKNVADVIMSKISGREQQTAKYAEITGKIVDMCVRGNLSPLFVIKNIYFLPTRDRFRNSTIELTLQVRLISALFGAYRKKQREEGVFISNLSVDHGKDEIGRYCEAKVKVTEYHKLPDETYGKDENYCTAKAHIEVKKSGEVWEQYPGKMLSWRAVSYLIDLLFSGVNEGVLSSSEFDESISIYTEDTEDVKDIEEEINNT